MRKQKKISPAFRKAVERHMHSAHIGSAVATVSGGADSCALLLTLKDSGCRVVAAHCNFHLRGEESMRDQRHVENLCATLSVPLVVKDFDVESHIASHRGVSVEMACRDLRYAWFRELAAIHGADRIATGHNADDNIETFFLNLLRGAGTSGLKGMTPDNGKVWRPLLCFHRSEIEEYLGENNISHITDSSNLTSDYRRNFLRNEVLPLLRSRWEGCDKALDRSISLIGNENRVVTEMVRMNLPDAGEPLLAETVLGFPDPELLVRRFIEPLKPFTTTAGEIVAAMRAAKPDIRRWSLRGGTVTLRNHRLILDR